MIAAWMGYVGLFTALIALAASGADRVAALLHWPRRIVWGVAFALAVLGPVLALRGQPTWPTTATAQPTESSRSTASAPISVRRVQPEERIGSDVRVSQSLLDSLDMPLIALWLFASVALIGMTLAQAVRHARARRRWTPGPFAGGQALVSPDTGPASIGVFHPVVVVPQWALRLSEYEQHLMLMHEREHIRARDPLVRAVCWTVCILVPWNPVAWWMLRRLALAIEIDCDARVLREAPDVAGYGGLLVDVGTRVQARHSFGPVTALSESASALEQRIIAMTTKRPPRYRRALAGVSLVAIAPILGATALPHPAARSLDLILPVWHSAQADSDVARANKAASAVLNDLVTLQESYFSDWNTYEPDVTKISAYKSPNFGDAGLPNPRHVKIRILGAYPFGWSAEATLPEMHGGSCIVLIAAVPRSAWPETAMEHKTSLNEGSAICDGDGQASGVSWAAAIQSLAVKTLKRRAELERDLYWNTGSYMALNFRTGARDLYQFTVLPGGKYYWAAEATINGVPGKSCVVWTGLTTGAERPPSTAGHRLTSRVPNAPVCDPM
jgi:hypothetical protein